jgi:nitrous oxidase accessory protein
MRLARSFRALHTPARLPGAIWPRRAARTAATACLALALLAPAPAAARRIFVPREHRSLQGAIDAASPGDTIWVAAGTYHGPIRITKRLVIFGDGGPDATFLDGGDSVRVVHVEGVNGGHLVGFTIRRGKAPGGGGVYCLRDTSYSISSCVMEKNWESGIALWQCTAVVVTDDVFRGNQGSGLSANSSKLLLRDTQFIGNHAQAGGGLSLVNSETISSASNCAFDSNRAEGGQGGGIFADSSIVHLASCAFTGNSSTVAGGAIAAVDSSTLWASRTRFQENHAASGGALSTDASNLDVALSIFDQNRATAAASAIQILGRALANVNPILKSCTFYKNTCTAGEGAAVYCQAVSPEFLKNIFVTEGANRAVVGQQSSPRFECNLIWDPSGAAIGSLPSPTTYVGDPRFCDPDKHDFHLRTLSLALIAPCGPIGAQGKGCSAFKVLPAR